MPWVVFVLLGANLALAAYLVLAGAPTAVRTDVRALEVNADKVNVVEPAARGSVPAAGAKPVARACLEWGTFTAAELGRAQAELAALGAARTIVREPGPGLASILIVEPTQNLVASLAQLPSAYPGTELRALACPAEVGRRELPGRGAPLAGIDRKANRRRPPTAWRFAASGEFGGGGVGLAGERTVIVRIPYEAGSMSRHRPRDLQRDPP